MADTKISDLAAASILTGAELVPVTQTLDTKRTSVDSILGRSIAHSLNLRTETILADANATLTATNLLKGVFSITPTIARTLTLPDAAAVIALMPGYAVGSNIEFTVVNKANFDVTLVAGANTTLSGRMTIKDGSGTWLLRIDSATAVTIYAKASATGGSGEEGILFPEAVTLLAGETVITVTGGYEVGGVVLVGNGAWLSPSDFTATNGSTITVAARTEDTDYVVWKFSVLSITDAITILNLQRQTYTGFPALESVAGTYTVTASPAVDLTANTQLRVTFNVTRLTGDTNLVVNSTASTLVKQRDSTGTKIDPVIVAGTIFIIEYDGTHWMILNPLPPTAVSLTNVAKLNADNTFTSINTPKGISTAVSTTSSVSYVPTTHGQVAEFALTNAITLTMSAPSGIVLHTPYTFVFKAGDTSARTLAWNAAYKFPSGIAPLTSCTITNGAYDTLSFVGGAGNTLIYVGSQADVR